MEISRGTLDNDSGINEETLTKVISRNPKLSPLWVMTGEGFMLKEENSEKEKIRTKNIISEDELAALIKEKDNKIKDLKDWIKQQDIIIAHLIWSSKKVNSY